VPKPFRIDANIQKAAGLPPAFYYDSSYFSEIIDRVFARTWHCAGDGGSLSARGAAKPILLLEGSVDEPLLFVNDGQKVQCYPNVCTHRGHPIVEKENCYESFVCGYHGRRFDLGGHCKQMPEFKGVEGFPSPADDLAALACEQFGKLLFISLDPEHPFEQLIKPVRERIGFLPIADFIYDSNLDREYEFDGNWALYVDNYLEGFHIPYIHPALNATMDWKNYRYELYDSCNLQIAYSAEGEPAFDLPSNHPDNAKKVAAYYFWLFPATMLNFYPWGLSVNIIEPLSPTKTRVKFRSYIWRAELRSKGAGSGLHQVEMEDEAAITSVQRGMKSRFAPRIRYSPTQETGVHHFHRLLAKYLQPAK